MKTTKTNDGRAIRLSKKQLKQLAAAKTDQKQWDRAKKRAGDLERLINESWKKKYPKFVEEFKRAPKVDKGLWGDFLPEGVRDTEILLVDSAGQKLDFRVGPVFGNKGVYKEPGIWIGVQKAYYCSPRDIELLISPKIWRRLNREMEMRFKEYNPRGYGPTKVISAKRKGTR